MDRTAIVVPVKSIFEGKSRLSKVLSDERRIKLNKYLLERTVKICRKVVRKEQLFVISNCTSTLELVSDVSQSLMENASGLNKALEQAAREVTCRGFKRLLVLPCDLTEVSHADVKALIKRAIQADHIAIVADRHGKGTNALFLKKIGQFRFCFGADSFESHQLEAKRASSLFVALQGTKFAFDLDTPEDFLKIGFPEIVEQTV